MENPKYDPAKVIELIERHKGNLSSVAKSLKCSRTTIQTYAREFPDVNEALHTARESITDVAESKLYSAIQKGELTAIIFYLKTQGRARGYVEKQVNLNVDMSTLSDDELRAIAES